MLVSALICMGQINNKAANQLRQSDAIYVQTSLFLIFHCDISFEILGLGGVSF
jgi:hypothetical protein